MLRILVGVVVLGFVAGTAVLLVWELPPPSEAKQIVIPDERFTR